MNLSFTDKIYHRNRRQDGFTLIEMMFALMIISISVLALYEMFNQGSGMLIEQTHQRMALERAEAHMELLQYWASKDDSIPLTLAGTYREYLVPQNDHEGQNGIEAEYVITIRYSDDRYENGLPKYSEASLTYKWTEPWTNRDEEIRLVGRF